MTTHEITTTVNGTTYSRSVEARVPLALLLRDQLGLTGTHIGCDTSNCGACTVLLDGESVKSCTILAVQADGAEVTTVEGLAQDGQFTPVQEGFRQKHGLQCGFCTPGMVMAAAALLFEHSDPTEQEIRIGLSGNLCRCTGYDMIVTGVALAAERGRGLW